METPHAPVVYMVTRSVTTSLMHGITTRIIGYGFQLLRSFRNMMLPLLFGLFSVAVITHSLFNLYVNSSLRLVGMTFPLILYVIGVMVLNATVEAGAGAEAAGEHEAR